MLDALASIDGTPAEIKAGNVTKEPPPAAAFIAPATRPATDRRTKFSMTYTLEQATCFRKSGSRESRNWRDSSCVDRMPDMKPRQLVPPLIVGGTPAGFLKPYFSPSCKCAMKTISCVWPARCINVRRTRASTVVAIVPAVTSY